MFYVFQYHTLCEASKKYESGSQYGEFVRRLPVSSAAATTQSNEYKFEPYYINARLVGFIPFFYTFLTLYPIETPFDAFANRADPDQAALVRAAWSVSTLFAYGNMTWKYDISDPTLVVLTRILYSMYQHESLFIYLFIVGGA